MGSIERTPAGPWKARYRDPQGRSRRKTFKRKRDAEMFLASADVDMRRAEWVDPNAGRMLLSDWVEEWRTTPCTSGPPPPTDTSATCASTCCLASAR